MEVAPQQDSVVITDDEFHAKYQQVAAWYVTAAKAQADEARRIGAVLAACVLASMTVLAVMGHVQAATTIALVGGLGGMWLFGRWRDRQYEELEDRLSVELGPGARAMGSKERATFFDMVSEEERRRGYRR